MSIFVLRRTNRVLLIALALGALIVAGALLLSCSNKGTDDVEGEPDDTTGPGTVTDLRVTNVTTNSVSFAWTAPGDDGNTGIVAGYDFRGSLDSITPVNFAQAIEVDSLVAPVPAGLTQAGTLVDLDAGVTYYFALKAYDDQGNLSALSNCVRADCPANLVVSIPDAALNTAVRSHISKPTGDILTSDLDTVTEFEASDLGIVDLTGMEYMTALGVTHLYNNDIVDVTPLGGLTHLWGLGLSGNQVTDLSPLTALTGLQQIGITQGPLSNIAPLAYLTGLKLIRLDYSQVTDFTPLQGLADLEELNISATPGHSIAFMSGMTSKLKTFAMTNLAVTDISALSSQTDVEELYCLFNSISDISVLANLDNLTIIDLRYNQVVDISPLVANAGLGSGDQVKLENNPLSAASINTHIPALQTRGVTVTY